MKIHKYECSKQDWKDFIEAFNSGRTLEIDQEMFMYWLEVLPPIYMHEVIEIEGVRKFCDFGFAEGLEPIKDFWKVGNRFFCKKSERMNSRF